MSPFGSTGHEMGQIINHFGWRLLGLSSHLVVSALIIHEIWSTFTFINGFIGIAFPKWEMLKLKFRSPLIVYMLHYETHCNTMLGFKVWQM
jgi:hypothetical protein